MSFKLLTIACIILSLCSCQQWEYTNSTRSLDDNRLESALLEDNKAKHDWKEKSFLGYNDSYSIYTYDTTSGYDVIDSTGRETEMIIHDVHTGEPTETHQSIHDVGHTFEFKRTIDG